MIFASTTMTAIDTEGNTFEKEVTIYPNGDGHTVIDFGFPITYRMSTILQDYPFLGDLCIDFAGRNHKGHPVTISKEQINFFINRFLEES